MNKISADRAQLAFDRATKIINSQQIIDGLDKVSKLISDKYYDKNPILLCPMNGGFIVTSEIMKRLKFPMRLDYIHASRYGDNKTLGGDLSWIKEPQLSFENELIIVIDDILDKGETLKEIIEFCYKKGAREVVSVVAFDKKVQRSPGGLKKADYHALSIEDFYVFGFGLDYFGYWRQLPELYAVHEEDMI